MGKGSVLGSIALLLSLVHIESAMTASGNEDLSAACHRPGFNPHPKDCWRFLICTEDAYGEPIAHEHSCPEHQVYSDEKQGCVPENNMKACKRGPRDGPTSDPDCKNTELSCLDCHSIVLCSKEGEIYHKIDVTNCTSGKYCDPKTISCTTVQPPECIPHGGCTSEGNFPSIKNCSIYYECKIAETRTLVEVAHTCPRGYVFDPNGKDDASTPEDEQCKQRDSPEACITVQCDGTVEIKKYTDDSKYYVVCTAEGIGYVYMCEIEGEIFDDTEKKCKIPEPTEHPV